VVIKFAEATSVPLAVAAGDSGIKFEFIRKKKEDDKK
jgi:hypothetical protein